MSKEAEGKVAASLQAAQEDGAGLAAVVTQNVPNITVKVQPGNVVSHKDKLYEEGKTLELDGPSAIALIQLGHVLPA